MFVCLFHCLSAVIIIENSWSYSRHHHRRRRQTISVDDRWFWDRVVKFCGKLGQNCERQKAEHESLRQHSTTGGRGARFVVRVVTWVYMCRVVAVVSNNTVVDDVFTSSQPSPTSYVLRRCQHVVVARNSLTSHRLVRTVTVRLYHFFCLWRITLCLVSFHMSSIILLASPFCPSYSVSGPEFSVAVLRSSVSGTQDQERSVKKWTTGIHGTRNHFIHCMFYRRLYRQHRRERQSQLQFDRDVDSIAIRLPLDGDSTAPRLSDVTTCDFLANQSYMTTSATFFWSDWQCVAL